MNRNKERAIKELQEKLEVLTNKKVILKEQHPIVKNLIADLSISKHNAQQGLKSLMDYFERYETVIPEFRKLRDQTEEILGIISQRVQKYEEFFEELKELEVDQLLDKISQQGKESLTQTEKMFLDLQGKKL